MWLQEYNDLPVVLYQSGEIVGYVETVHYLMGEKHLQGISFRKKGKARRRGYAAYPELNCLGENVVVISGYGLHPEKPTDQETNYRLYGTDGQLLGNIHNVLLDEKGRLRAWELSKSLYEDLKNGREILPVSGKIITDGDRVVMTNETKDLKGGKRK